MNLYAYPTNPVRFSDHKGLEPTAQSSFEQITGTSTSVFFIGGDGYWQFGWPPYKSVPHIQPNSISMGSSCNPGTSSEFVKGLESSGVFIYTGHHFGQGDILLDDGHFNARTLFKQAKRLPKYVLMNACNTATSLPLMGEYPETTFIGYDNFIDNTPAFYAGQQAASDLRSSDPIGNLNANKGKNVPGIVIVGPYPVPYR